MTGKQIVAEAAKRAAGKIPSTTIFSRKTNQTVISDEFAPFAELIEAARYWIRLHRSYPPSGSARLVYARSHRTFGHHTFDNAPECDCDGCEQTRAALAEIEKMGGG